MKKLIILLSISLAFTTISFAQERTLQDIQKDYAAWQKIYQQQQQQYNTGVAIVDKAIAGMKTSGDKIQALVEEAKALQKAPVKSVDPDCPDGNCPDAPVK